MTSRTKSARDAEATPKPSTTYTCRCPIFKDVKHLSADDCLASLTTRYEGVVKANKSLADHFGVKPEETEFLKCGCGGPLFINKLTGRKTLVCPPCMKRAYDQLLKHANEQDAKIAALEKGIASFSLAC